MKVVYISNTHFDDTTGGAERYAMCLAQHVSALADTTLVSFSRRRQSLCQGQLRIELYPVKHFIKRESKELAKLDPFNLQFLETIKESDIVHVHNLHAFVSDLGTLVSAFEGKKTVVTDHGVFARGVLSRRLPVFSCYKRAVAQSLFAKNGLPAILQNRTVIVKGGVDRSKFYPSGTEKREPKILFVGRIAPQKGIHTLLEAFRLLRSTEHKLVIVGKVHDHQYFEDLVRLSYRLPVTFQFNVNDAALVNEYQTAQVTVLPSQFDELMGQVLLESQACGTPVVCSNVGALHEFVLQGETGLVVKKDSAEAIAEALDQLLHASATEQAKRQAKCREWIMPFDWQRVTEKHLNIYRELANS